MRVVFAALAQIMLAGLLFSAASGPRWEHRSTGSHAGFRGLSARSANEAWVSGTLSTILHTTDGGRTWHSTPIAGAADLDFRDIEAIDDKIAYALSIGPGEKSRIYKTTDGGVNWRPQFINSDPNVFLDCMGFWDAGHGIVLGDPVNGHFVLMITDDGGASWAPLPQDSEPPALPGEGAFAASGSCLVVQGSNDVWFATGGGEKSRVFRSADRGKSWAIADTPVTAGKKSAGIFSLTFSDEKRGVAVGGDYQSPRTVAINAAFTNDGGKTWQPAQAQPHGFLSAVAFVPGEGGQTLIAVGTSASDISQDGGSTWQSFSTSNFNVAAFGASADSGWAAGPDGAVARLALLAGKRK